MVYGHLVILFFVFVDLWLTFMTGGGWGGGRNERERERGASLIACFDHKCIFFYINIFIGHNMHIVLLRQLDQNSHFL